MSEAKTKEQIAEWLKQAFKEGFARAKIKDQCPESNEWEQSLACRRAATLTAANQQPAPATEQHKDAWAIPHVDEAIARLKRLGISRRDQSDIDLAEWAETGLAVIRQGAPSPALEQPVEERKVVGGIVIPRDARDDTTAECEWRKWWKQHGFGIGICEKPARAAFIDAFAVAAAASPSDKAKEEIPEHDVHERRWLERPQHKHIEATERELELLAVIEQMREWLDEFPLALEAAGNNECLCATQEHGCPYCSAQEKIARQAEKLAALQPNRAALDAYVQEKVRVLVEALRLTRHNLDNPMAHGQLIRETIDPALAPYARKEGEADGV